MPERKVCTTEYRYAKSTIALQVLDMVRSWEAAAHPLLHGLSQRVQSKHERTHNWNVEEEGTNECEGQRSKV